MSTAVIHYRPFRNTDLPALAEIWRSRSLERGLAQPMSAALFEHLVLSKPYFDRHGLIVALDDDRPIGFVHGAFGPSEDEQTVSHEFGVVCMLLVHPDYRNLGIGSELLKRSEAYLRERGAKVLYAGGIRPLNPFYLGLYGGSELPGVLDSDADAQRRYESSGYERIDRCVIMHRDLSTFRPTVDRKQLQLRRTMRMEIVTDPCSRTWWEACTTGGFDRTTFRVLPRDGDDVLATVTFWNMEARSISWGVYTVGLVDLEVAETHRRQGLATFLLGESFRQLREHQISLVEVQTMERNKAAIALYESLGFNIVDRGVVYRKAT